MTLETAIQLATEEAQAFKVKVLVVESPDGMRFFPCRQDWLEGFGQGHKVMAEAHPNGKIHTNPKGTTP
jgi:hypothetical protein